MTTEAEALQAINDRFLANWTEFTTDNLSFGNERFEPKGLPEWGRATVVETATRQQIIGPPNQRGFLRQGVLIFNIYTLLNQGMSRSAALVQAFRNLFEGVSFSNLRFFQAPLLSRTPDGEWLQTTIQSLFDYLERR